MVMLNTIFPMPPQGTYRTGFIIDHFIFAQCSFKSVFLKIDMMIMMNSNVDMFFLYKIIIYYNVLCLLIIDINQVLSNLSVFVKEA